MCPCERPTDCKMASLTPHLVHLSFGVGGNARPKVARQLVDCQNLLTDQAEQLGGEHLPWGAGGGACGGGT